MREHYIHSAFYIIRFFFLFKKYFFYHVFFLLFLWMRHLEASGNFLRIREERKRERKKCCFVDAVLGGGTSPSQSNKHRNALRKEFNMSAITFLCEKYCQIFEWNKNYCPDLEARKMSNRLLLLHIGFPV